MLKLNSNTFATFLGIGSMVPGMQLCAIKLTVLAREEPRLEYRVPTTSRSWLDINIDVRGSGRHLPFSLFLVWGFLVFIHLLLRQKGPGEGLSLCPTWTDQHSCSGCVSKVISSPAVHFMREILWCFNTARGRQSHSAQPEQEGKPGFCWESQKQTCCQTPECRKERAFLREAVMSHTACLQRWHWELRAALEEVCPVRIWTEGLVSLFALWAGRSELLLYWKIIQFMF